MKIVQIEERLKERLYGAQKAFYMPTSAKANVPLTLSNILESFWKLSNTS